MNFPHDKAGAFGEVEEQEGDGLTDNAETVLPCDHKRCRMRKFSLDAKSVNLMSVTSLLAVLRVVLSATAVRRPEAQRKVGEEESTLFVLKNPT